MRGCLTFFKRCLLGAGVIVPLFSLIMEFRTNDCAKNIFDPIPTWMHLGLVLLMPASILAPLMARRFPKTLWMPAGDFLHGSGLLASVLYMLGLGPMNIMGLLAPLALPFLALFGTNKEDVLTFSLLVPTMVGPLTALAAWYVIFLRFLRKLRKRRYALPWLGGLAFSLVAIIVAEWPMIGFKEDVREALQIVPGHEEKSGDPLSRLRTPPREAALLRMCYFSDGPKCFGPLMSLFQWAEASERRPENPELEELRTLHFQVTGTRFSDAAPPRGRGHSLFP